MIIPSVLIRKASAPALSLLLAVLFAAVSPALAKSGSLRGRVTVERGALPDGSMVRATPLDGGAVLTAPITGQGLYALSQVPEGAYMLEVVSAEGSVIGGGTKTLVSPMALQVNLKVREIAPSEKATKGQEGRRDTPQPSEKREELKATARREEKSRATEEAAKQAAPKTSIVGAWPIATESVAGVAVAIVGPGEEGKSANKP